MTVFIRGLAGCPFLINSIISVFAGTFYTYPHDVTGLFVGYPGNSGSKAYDLAHIKIVDKEKWWRKHPEVLKIVYGNRPFKGYK